MTRCSRHLTAWKCASRHCCKSGNYQYQRWKKLKRLSLHTWHIFSHTLYWGIWSSYIILQHTYTYVHVQMRIGARAHTHKFTHTHTCMHTITHSMTYVHPGLLSPMHTLDIDAYLIKRTHIRSDIQIEAHTSHVCLHRQLQQQLYMYTITHAHTQEGFYFYIQQIHKRVHT